MKLSEFKKAHEEFELLRNTYKLDIERRAKVLKPARVSAFMGEQPAYVGSSLHNKDSLSIKKLIAIAEAVEKLEEIINGK